MEGLMASAGRVVIEFSGVLSLGGYLYVWQYRARITQFLTTVPNNLSISPDKKDPKWCFKHFVNYRSLKTANEVRSQLERIMAKHKLLSPADTGSWSMDAIDNVKRALVSGFFMQSAHFDRKGNYLTIMDNQVVRLHPSTGLTRKPEWVVYNEVVMTTNNFIRIVTEINPAW